MGFFKADDFIGEFKPYEDETYAISYGFGKMIADRANARLAEVFNEKSEPVKCEKHIPDILSRKRTVTAAVNAYGLPEWEITTKCKVCGKELKLIETWEEVHDSK